LVRAIAAGTLIPILCCSTKQDVGVTELLDFLAQYGLTPADVVRKGTKNGAEVTLQPVANSPLSARIYRTRIDPFVQKLSFIRIFSGTLKKDVTVPSPGSRKGV
jgi:elongation factor G